MAQVVWYAKKGNCNIDDTTLWTLTKGGTDYVQIADATDGVNGTILAANGQTGIAINVDFTAVRISTAIEAESNAGGGFTVASARTVRANILAGTNTCITMSSGAYTLTIYGNVTGGSASSTVGILGDGSSSTITVYGDVIGGSYISAYGITTSYSGITVNGSLIASNAPAVFQSQNAPLTVYNGNIINSGYSSAIYGRYAVVYNPGPNNYIEYTATAGTAKYGKTIGHWF
jgi:hypothetical protein